MRSRAREEGADQTPVFQLRDGRIAVIDRAVEEGNWTWTAPTPKGEQKDNGKFLVIWQKIGGTWKVVQDMWNSDNPPPIPAK